jgi:hypothetical protein
LTHQRKNLDLSLSQKGFVFYVFYLQSIIASAAALGIIKGLCVTHLWHEAYSYLPFINDDNQLQAMTE